MRHWLPVCLALLTSAPTAEGLTIRSDELWRGARCLHQQDAAESEDTKTWTAVEFPWIFIAPRELSPDPTARPMWEQGGVRRACLQRTFELADVPSEPAVVHVWVDEQYELLLNGQRVGASTKKYDQQSYDVTSLLKPGRNVIRLNVDGGPYAVGAIFSLTVPGAPEEPISWPSRLHRAAPWLIFLAFVVGAPLLALLVTIVRRRATPSLRRLNAHVWVVGLVGLTAMMEWLFLTQHFYDAQWIYPWCRWDWPVVSVAVAGLIALIVWASGERVQAGGPLAPRLHTAAFVTILAIAVILRTYDIDRLPPGMWGDESLNGNEALELFEHAEQGPVVWSPSVGGRGTLFLYMIGAALKIFGVSYLTLKIAPVATGVLAVVAIYVLGRVAFEPRVALWAAFLLAVGRYHIHYSRMAWEAICVPTIATAGVALLLHGLRGQRWARTSLLASGAVLALGLYTYAAYRAVPAVIALFALWTLCTPHRAVLRRHLPWLFGSAATAIVVVAPLASFAFRNPSQYWYRYNEVSLTSFMTYYATPLPWLHQIGRTLLAINHKGDEIIRHNLPHAPQFDPITGALFLIGMVTAVRPRTSWGQRLLWSWLLAYSAFASLTRDGPHATRLIGLIPVVTLFAAYGLSRLLAAVRGAGRSPRFLLALSVAVAVAITSRNAYEYFVLEANHRWADSMWNLAGRSVCEYLRGQSGIELYRDPDIATQIDSPCRFLARGRYTPHDLHVEDVQSSRWRTPGDGKTVVVFGPAFVDKHRSQLARDGGALPNVDLPVEPRIERDRSGGAIYYLYRF